jgi:hypothetical protein
MDYLAFLRFRPSVPATERDAALKRRAGWQYPADMRLIAEYWPTSSEIQVVSIFSATEFPPVMQLVLEWSDVFDISGHPAVSVEDGLRIGEDVVGKLARLAPS